MILNLLRLNKSNVHSEYEEIAYQITNMRNEIEIAINNFNHSSSNELIDIYTYKLKLLYSNYEYLLKKVNKHKAVKIDTENKTVVNEFLNPSNLNKLANPSI